MAAALPPRLLLRLLLRFAGNHRQREQLHAAAVTGGHLTTNLPPKTTILTSMAALLYNALILSYLNTDNPSVPFLLFSNMLSHGPPPTPSTFPSLLKSASTFSPPLSFSLHSLSLKLGFSLHPFVHTSLLSLHSRLGSSLSAGRLFDETPHPSLAASNAMISALCRSGDALSARKVFDEMPERDVFSWTAMISGLRKDGRSDEALSLFGEMARDGRVRPGEPTYVTGLSLCSAVDGSRGLGYGRQTHGHIVKCGPEVSVLVGTALVSMYGKLGRPETAVRVMTRMVRKGVSTWNATISCLASNGRGGEALAVLARMEVAGTPPNEVTFVALLNACARVESVEAGVRVFRSMACRYGVVPRMQHYGCVVGLLGRAGLLTEAWELTRKMPMEADASVLRSLLAAARVHGAAALGDEVGRRVIELQPAKCGGYVTLSSIYADADEWHRAADVRGAMADAGVLKLPGLSYFADN